MKDCKNKQVKKFDNKAKQELKHYVYVYSDPFTKKPFYIGEGIDNRCFNHLKEEDTEKEKVRKIKEIRARGKEPLIEILAYGLDQKTAFKVEAAAIDLIGIDNLTNLQKGHGADKYGRVPVDVLLAKRNKSIKLIDIKVKAIIIILTKSFDYNMSDFELYDRTRGCWALNIERAEKAEYVFVVHDKIIHEVYTPTHWFESGNSMYSFNKSVLDKDKKRYEFIGKLAPENIRKKYHLKKIEDLKSYGQPIKYVRI